MKSNPLMIKKALTIKPVKFCCNVMIIIIVIIIINIIYIIKNLKAIKIIYILNIANKNIYINN